VKEVLQQLQNYIAKKKPCMFVLENVKQLILTALKKLANSAYHVEWEVLDTQGAASPGQCARLLSSFVRACQEGSSGKQVLWLLSPNVISFSHQCMQESGEWQHAPSLLRH